MCLFRKYLPLSNSEAILRHYCDVHGLDVIVDSAGTSNYHPNKAPDLRSQQHASKRGYDLSTIRARQITLNDFLDFDLILAMDHENFKDVQHLKTQAIYQFGSNQVRSKIALMSEHDPEFTRQAIPDPYYGERKALIAYLISANQVVWLGSIF